MAPEASFTRDARGDWRPEGALAPTPLFVWPPRPIALMKWLCGYPGHLLPWTLGYLVLAALTWRYLTPEWARMRTLAVI